MGADKIAAQVHKGAQTQAVTEPLSALVAASAALGIHRLAFLSPYVETVSGRLRDALRAKGVQTPVFGTFAESEEAKVVRISPDAIRQAALDLAAQGNSDAIFLSCTNLNTLDIIAPLEAETGLPVLSSNQVLAWHMCQLAGVEMTQASGRLTGM
ncbi:MAG: maleate isomerase [Paracoccaceae bacterium]